jgi:hypothetical protein
MGFVGKEKREMNVTKKRESWKGISDAFKATFTSDF